MRVLKVSISVAIAGALLAAVPAYALADENPANGPTSKSSTVASSEHFRGDKPVWSEQPKIDDSKKAKPAAAPTIDIDFSKAPDLEPVANDARKVLEEWYPKVSEMLPTEGYVPPQQFAIVFDPDYDGVAGVADNTMTVGAKYMREHPDDLGMFVHESTHIIQQYGGNDVPGWLTEGVADYIRYYQYQPDDNPIPGEERTSYTDGYGQAAFLLNYVRTKYADDFVSVANDAARRNVYSPELWTNVTGKDVDTLWNEAVAAG